MDILRDTGWQAIIGLLGIVVAVVIYLLQRKKKRLAYTVLTETPLLSVNDEIKGKIKIAYEAKDIQNVNLVILKIENRGNVHIASSDFEQKPIIFSFPGSEILSAEITDTFPGNLKPVIKTETPKLIIDPVLLNKKDYFVCKLIFSNYENKIEVDARIIGVNELERGYIGDDDPFPVWAGILTLFFAAGTTFMTGVFLAALFLSNNRVDFWAYIFIFFLATSAFTGYLLLIYGYIARKKGKTQ